MATVDQKIGELTSTANFTANAICDIKRTLEHAEAIRTRNADEQAAFREHVTTTLATMSAQVLAFTEYTKRCELDRESLDSRTKALELWKSRQSGQISILVAFSLVLGSAFEGLFGGWGHLKDLFR